MGYKRAEEILPVEVIELIQQYVDGASIYIPRKQENRQEWGLRQATDGNWKTGMNRFTMTICPGRQSVSWRIAIIYPKKAYSGFSDKKDYQM